MIKKISKSTLERLPLYLNYLKTLPANGNISATALSSAMQFGEVQVRKDLASVSTSGRPKTGYSISDLIYDLEIFLGYKNTDHAVIVGAGKLGSALMNYQGFTAYGLKIVAAFDNNPCVLNKSKHIFDLSKFEDLIQRMKVQIGIITVPAVGAQEICDRMVAAGIQAIWNFAPIKLKVPKDIFVQNENMASSLAILSNHLKQLSTN